MSPELPIQGEHTIRRFQSADAPGIVSLVRAVYADTYYPTDLYEPQRIVLLNQEERLISVVAVTPGGEVVGHYGLERATGAVVAESSDALVLPTYRHHRILEDSRPLLQEEAIRLGLAGLVGYPVTNHLFSQKAEEHWGAKPCGIALGLWPREFHNMPEPLPQRMTFVMYFKRLRPVATVRHVATHHKSMLERLCQAEAIEVEYVSDGTPTGTTELKLEFEAPVSSGSLQVQRLGADAAHAIREAKGNLCMLGARAMMLELPLDQPGVAATAQALEAEGFFFCGLGPAFADGSDALLLQWVAEPIDPALIQIESDLARELLAYADQDRQRVGG